MKKPLLWIIAALILVTFVLSLSIELHTGYHDEFDDGVINQSLWNVTDYSCKTGGGSVNVGQCVNETYSNDPSTSIALPNEWHMVLYSRSAGAQNSAAMATRKNYNMSINQNLTFNYHAEVSCGGGTPSSSSSFYAMPYAGRNEIDSNVGCGGATGDIIITPHIWDHLVCNAGTACADTPFRIYYTAANESVSVYQAGVLLQSTDISALSDLSFCIESTASMSVAGSEYVRTMITHFDSEEYYTTTIRIHSNWTVPYNPYLGDSVKYRIHVNDTVVYIDNVNIRCTHGASATNWTNATNIGADVWETTSFNANTQDLYTCTAIARNSAGDTDTTFLTFTPITSINLTNNSIAFETSTQPFSFEANYNVSWAQFYYNGTQYTPTASNLSSAYTRYYVKVSAPLLEANTTTPFWWNYTMINGTWNQHNGTQNIALAFLIDFKKDLLAASYLEGQSLFSYYNFTNYSNSAAMSTHKFLVNQTAFSSIQNGTTNNLTTFAGYIAMPTASVPTNTNVAGWVNISFNGKSSIRVSNDTTSVAPINIFACTDAANTTTVTFYIKDEDFQGPLYSTFEAILNITPLGIGLPLTKVFNLSGQNNYSICMDINSTYSVDTYIKYRANGSFTHFYYEPNLTLTNAPQNITLYNFNNTDGKSNLKINVRNKNTYAYYSNIIGRMQRFYVGENVWRSVQDFKTGDYGMLFYNIYEENTDYRFIFKDNSGCILKVTDSMKFVCTAASCELTYLVSPCVVSTTQPNLSVVIYYNNVSNNITTYWDDPTGSTTDIGIWVTRETLSGTATMCNTTSTGSTGTYNCNVGSFQGIFMVRVSSSTNGNLNPEVTTFLEVKAQKLSALVGKLEAALWTFGLMLTIIMLGVVSPVAIIIMSIAALIVIYFLGLWSAISIGMIIGAIAIGLLISWKVKT